MATVGEAISALSLPQDGGDLVIVKLRNGTAENYLLSEVADKEIGKDVYLKTGTYATGSVSRNRGASKDNLVRINELPFDFDAADYFEIPKAELWAMPDAALWPLIEHLQREVETTFAAIGLELHRIDYTGYGLAGYLRLPLHKPESIPAIIDLHARIVERINKIARAKMCDPQVKDAGTRFMRIPGCLNTKGAIPRLTRTLVKREGMVNEEQLAAAAGAVSRMQARIVPATGAGLDEVTTRTLIDSVRPHWNEGQRHRLAMAISGLLAKAGVPEEQTAAIIESLAVGDDTPWDRAKAVHTTYERVRAGQNVQGYYGLQESLPSDLVAWLDGVAQRVYQASHPKIVAGGGVYTQPEESKSRRTEFEEVPAAALTGWIGSYCEVMTPTTESPVAFHVGVGLTVAGALIGRHVYSQYGTDPLYANLYTLLVGRSGRTRKDTAIKRATRVLFDHTAQGTRIIDHGVGIATDVGSSTKLIDILAKKPNTLLYLTEFSRLMGNARRQATDTIIPTLMEAFDTPTQMQNNSMANPIEALYPYLSIIAATQPDILSDTMSGTDMNSGFANRWFFVCGNLGEPNPLPPVLDRVVVGKLLHDLWDARRSYSQGTALHMSPDAIAVWQDWYLRDFHRESPSAEEDAMRARHAVLIQKIALIYAVCDGSRRVEEKHLNVGIALVEWMWDQIKRLTPMWGRTIDGQIEARIKAILERGPMKRRDIQQRCDSRKYSGVEFGRAFDAMVKNQTIVVDPFGMVCLNEE